jgi:hypothetical protein
MGEIILVNNLENGQIFDNAIYVKLKDIYKKTLYGVTLPFLPSKNEFIQVSLKKYGKTWKSDDNYQGFECEI